MVKKKKGRFKTNRFRIHLIEGFFVFAGVLFAFLLTEYREARKDSKAVEVSLQHIASEISYNHYRIEYIFKYHTDLLSEIDSLEKNDQDWEELKGDVLKSWEGLQTPLLRSASYQTFLNSNLTDKLDFELAESVNRIYYIQSISERLDKSFMESSLSNLDRFISLSGLKNITQAYLSTLPDVMLEYQVAQEEWLDSYGYNNPIEKKELKKVVEGRRQYNYNH